MEMPQLRLLVWVEQKKPLVAFWLGEPRFPLILLERNSALIAWQHPSEQLWFGTKVETENR
jgi:hypothetical protein